MPFNASDYYLYYQPKPCRLKVYLKAHGPAPAEPDVYQQMLARLGERHEKRHLQALGTYVDAEASAAMTLAATERGEAVIYQPCMRVTSDKYGEIVGVPDFFIRQQGGYAIRDCKLSRRFDQKNHAEIFRQLQLYGWLYEQTFGKRPTALEAIMGDGTLQGVPSDPTSALEDLQQIEALKQLPTEPYEPIGWSKCSNCGWGEYCLQRAMQSHDVAILPSVDQNLARALYAQGIRTYEDLHARYDAPTLSELKRPVGKREVRVGAAAERILREAQAFIRKDVVVMQRLPLSPPPNLVMFDVEGLPAYPDISERTYLWGLKVFGERPSSYLPALGGVGSLGDDEGWRHFLAQCQAIFGEYGNVAFVHWSEYEKTQVKNYVRKYGDPNGIAQRLLDNLLDLNGIVKTCLALPLPSYSLKVLEKFVGYKRVLPDTGGKWSMATYIEAIETEDQAKAVELVNGIMRYNEEDLDATWAVYQWALQYA